MVETLGLPPLAVSSGSLSVFLFVQFPFQSSGLSLLQHMKMFIVAYLRERRFVLVHYLVCPLSLYINISAEPLPVSLIVPDLSLSLNL